MVRLSPVLLASIAGSGLPLYAQAAGLNTAAKAVGLKYFGTATDNPELSDTAYETELNNTQDFGQLTPANSMKVSLTAPPWASE